MATMSGAHREGQLVLIGKVGAIILIKGNLSVKKSHVRTWVRGEVGSNCMSFQLFSLGEDVYENNQVDGQRKSKTTRFWLQTLQLLLNGVCKGLYAGRVSGWEESRALNPLLSAQAEFFGTNSSFV